MLLILALNLNLKPYTHCADEKMFKEWLVMSIILTIFAIVLAWLMVNHFHILPSTWNVLREI